MVTVGLWSQNFYMGVFLKKNFDRAKTEDLNCRFTTT